MTIDYDHLPTGGFANLVSELLVEDLGESLYFWREALGFEIAYQRPEQKFAYLERPEGAQIMLCERSEGIWETGPIRSKISRFVQISGILIHHYSNTQQLQPSITHASRYSETV